MRGGWLVRKAARRVLGRSPRLMDWALAIRRVHHTYRLRHGRPLALLRPRRFTEKMQWRKLFDLNPMFAILSDKLAVREFVRQRVGSEFLIPLLWSGEDPEAIPFDALEPPYVIKSSHASGHVIRVLEGSSVDRDAVIATARSWLTHCHGTAMDEPGYVHAPRRVMVERLLLDPNGAPPLERKLFTFNGQVQVVLTVKVEGDGERLNSYHDPEWLELPWKFNSPKYPGSLPRLPQLDRIFRVARKLADEFDHMRIDMYEHRDNLYVGELTVYSYSGFEPVDPDRADFILGGHWRLRYPALRAVASILTRRRRISPVSSPPTAS